MLSWRQVQASSMAFSCGLQTEIQRSDWSRSSFEWCLGSFLHPLFVNYALLSLWIPICWTSVKMLCISTATLYHSAPVCALFFWCISQENPIKEEKLFSKKKSKKKRFNNNVSQNHRMVWVRKDLTDHLFPTPIPWAGTPSIIRSSVEGIYFISIISNPPVDWHPKIRPSSQKLQ